MSYKIKETDYEVIVPIAEKLCALADYESLILKDSKDNVDRLRYLLYAWLYESGQKKRFKVIRRSPEQLEVLRKGNLAPEYSVVDRVNEFVRDHLIELETEDDVAVRIREAISGSVLSLDEGTRALTEWQRAQGLRKMDRVALD